MSAIRTLHVDDDEVNLLTFGAILEDQGHVMTSVGSLARARAVLRDATFDLAVLDVHLGDGLGPDLIPELRARCPGIAIAVVSGSLANETIPNADVVIAKGSDPREILAQLAKAVQRGR